jgi:hypothetical protein
MRDRDIRITLRRELRKRYSQHGTLLIDELGLCQGNARVDMAVVNGALSGYEIKSEVDTLQRLPHQIDVYSKILDHVTVVASGSHIEKADKLVPCWWGLTEAIDCDGQVVFRVIRQSQSNQDVDPLSLAQLLWRNETLTILNGLGITKGLSGKPRYFLWQKLAENQSLDDLKTSVRECLKVREGWRPDPPQTLSGDSFQCDAT